MTLVNVIYWVISIIAVFLYVLSVQFKEKKNILIIQIFASMCYLIVYLIKGIWATVLIEVLEEVKNVFFLYSEKHSKKIPLKMLFIFLLILLIISIWYYDGMLSLLPLIINILGFISTYYKNPKYIRRIVFVCGALWGIYNIYVGAYIIVIGNVLEMISAAISIYKFRNIDNNFDTENVIVESE